MTDFDRARRIFLAACHLPEDARPRFLDRECGDDAALRREVESLLRHDLPPVEAGGSPGESTYALAGAPTAGHQIGRYRIIHEIGRGGIGIVYAAVREDDQFRRRIALKVIKRGMDTEDILRRFDLERQLLAALNHPNIGRLYDGGRTDDGRPYFAMEYVDGQPIDHYCDTHRLRIGERLKLFQGVCSAVHHAHQNLVVHRDLKPANILVTEKGIPKLLDFGIAKLINPDFSLLAGPPTSPELRIMTPEYASPEQVRGAPITTASDIYSLGVLLYEIVSGHRPYRFKSRMKAEIERVICEEDPERPSTALTRIEEISPDNGTGDVPSTVTPESVSRNREGRPHTLQRQLRGDIDNIVFMAMRKEPQRRYQSAEQFAEDIGRHLDRQPVIARAATPGYRLWKFARRNRLVVGAVGAVLVALLLGAVVAVLGLRTALVARESAIEQRVEADRLRDAAETAHAAEAAARRQAQRMQTEAEAAHDRARELFGSLRSLAHVFLFDVHDAIKKLDGSLPARDLLVATAHEYLAKATASCDEDDSELRKELALGYRRLGDVLGSMREEGHGEVGLALEHYRTSLATLLELAARSPEDDSIRRELATGHVVIADVLMNTGDVNGALREYRVALDTSRQLLDSDNWKLRRFHAVMLANVGEGLIRTGHVAEGKEYYRRSLELRRALLAQDPSKGILHRDVSRMLIRLGYRRQKEGQYERTLDHYREALTHDQESVSLEPDNSRARQHQAQVHYYMGMVLALLGRSTEAEEHVAETVTIAETRVHDNPGNATARENLVVVLMQAGEIRGTGGDTDSQRDAIMRARDICGAFVDAGSVDRRHRVWIAACDEQLGVIAQRTGNEEEADLRLSAALAEYQPLSEADPADIPRRQDLARALARLGVLRCEQGRMADAVQLLNHAQELGEGLIRTAPTDVTVRAQLVETYSEQSRLWLALGDSPAAVTAARRALEVAQNRAPELLLDLALALERTDARDEALDLANEALDGLATREPRDEEDLEERLEALRGRLSGG